MQREPWKIGPIRAPRGVRSRAGLTALVAVVTAVLAGAGFSLAIGALRSDGSPGSTVPPTHVAEGTASPTATEASPSASPMATPTPSATSQPPTPAPSSGPPTPSAQPSPVNGRIAWAGTYPGDIITSQPDGTGQGPLFSSPADERNAVWSPDGRSLAYISDAAGGSVEVADLSGRRTVVHSGSFTHGTYYSDGIAWSPDGDRLALALVPGYVQVVDLDGNVIAQFAGGSPRHVAWSPRGDLVAYVSGRSLMIGDPTTSETRAVVVMESNVRFPMWTDGGRRLLFHGYTETGNTEIFGVNLDGTDFRNVTNTPDLFEDVPALSPDGSMLAMVVTTGSTQRIEVMELATGERRELLAMRGLGSSSWAPDGTHLVVGHGESITVVPIDGSPPADIGTGMAPSWGTSP